jgi:hypothetical protein
MKKRVELTVECMTLRDKERPMFRAKRAPEYLVIIWKSVGEYQSMVCQMKYPSRALAVEAYKRLTQ